MRKNRTHYSAAFLAASILAVFTVCAVPIDGTNPGTETDYRMVVSDYHTPADLDGYKAFFAAKQRLCSEGRGYGPVTIGELLAAGIIANIADAHGWYVGTFVPDGYAEVFHQRRFALAWNGDAIIPGTHQSGAVAPWAFDRGDILRRFREGLSPESYVFDWFVCEYLLYGANDWWRGELVRTAEKSVRRRMILDLEPVVSKDGVNPIAERLAPFFAALDAPMMEGVEDEAERCGLIVRDFDRECLAAFREDMRDKRDYYLERVFDGERERIRLKFIVGASEYNRIVARLNGTEGDGE